MKDFLKRLRSPIVWTAAVAQIYLIVDFFDPKILGGFKIILTAIVEILTIFGLLNNPSDRDHF